MTGVVLRNLNVDSLSEMLDASIIEQEFTEHFHETYSLGIILDGQCDFRCEGNEMSVKAGEICLFNPFQVHTGGTKKNKLRYKMLYPSIEWLFANFPRFTHEAMPIFKRPILQDERAFDKISKRLKSTLSSDDMYFIVDTVIKNARYELKPLLSPLSLDFPVGAACKHITENWDQQIVLSKLAQDLGLSKWHFSRVFKEKVGISPVKYIRQVRLGKAKQLLQSGTKLSDAAIETLFSDQAHLNREFKKINGTTPGEFLSANCNISRQ